MDSMRQIYETATGDAQSMFQGASERFSEIVQGMRAWPATCSASWNRPGRNCAAAFWNCRRKTAESAAQMRRVIVDQIEALAELNRIVACHGREIEVSEPVAAAASREKRCR